MVQIEASLIGARSTLLIITPSWYTSTAVPDILILMMSAGFSVVVVCCNNSGQRACSFVAVIVGLVFGCA